MEEKITVVFVDNRNHNIVDFETETGILLSNLLKIIDSVLELGIDVNNISEREIAIENPICLVKTDMTLEKLGFRQGTTLVFK